MTTALGIIDAQNDFVTGTLAVPGADVAIEKIINLLDKGTFDALFTSHDFHVDPEGHFSRNPDYVDSWPVHCVKGTEGSALVEDLEDKLTWYDRAPYDQIFKGQYDAGYSAFDGRTFHQVPLDIWLRAHQVDEIVLVGIAFGHCVYQTALSALRLGYKVKILKDCTASVDPSCDELHTAMLESLGVEVVQ